MSRRISASPIVSAFIVAAALTIHSCVRLHIRDAPLIGTIAFTIRRYLGIWLVYSILKPGRS